MTRGIGTASYPRGCTVPFRVMAVDKTRQSTVTYCAATGQSNGGAVGLLISPSAAMGYRLARTARKPQTRSVSQRSGPPGPLWATEFGSRHLCQPAFRLLYRVLCRQPCDGGFEQVKLIKDKHANTCRGASASDLWHVGGCPDEAESWPAATTRRGDRPGAVSSRQGKDALSLDR